ncbi:hypothetical protein [Helicobacter pylori]|uniref:Periplasmic protein n=1 Tax=Helicobacter pylori (strain B8) TaxID=693745 RepID=D7FCU9_HELP3|nr:hypothetical protein [Helicobacter pylori]AVG73380.1 hypothetical protein BXP01_02145 [Helicobacter pylori]AVG79429.1 hypothetical protein BXP12_02145 [Helicobacter pylori]AVG80901.1 hypothetical protein BXP17_02150 [Helicobacter pylori]AVG82358.1 hypothetical protein BXP20_02125 [Helicobacter pylori]AVG83741.1 hypothetical protein BXP19_02130 [Helicobacter pylori]
MRFKSVVAFISLAVALGVLAYLFLSVKKEMPATSHAISQTNEGLSQTDTKSHDINLEENSPDEISHNEKASHNQEVRNNALSQNLDAQEVINYPVIEHHFEIPFEEKKREYSKLIIKDLKDYQWWCLKEILKKEQIDYAYDSTKNQPNLIIYLDKNKKERFLADLDYYKIRYHAVF